jgi:type II secretory pathway component PulC
MPVLQMRQEEIFFALYNARHHMKNIRLTIMREGQPEKF